MPKKIVFIGMTIFLIFISISNIKFLNNQSVEIKGFSAFFQGIYTSFCITGIFAFSGLMFPLYKILPQDYYTIKNTDFIRKIYHLLKVDWFGYFLTKTFYKPKNKRITFFNGTRTGIDGFLNKTKESEFNHLLPLIILVIISIYFTQKNQFQLAGYITLVNIFLNLYPIILQRFHRVRLQKILN